MDCTTKTPALKSRTISIYKMSRANRVYEHSHDVLGGTLWLEMQYTFWHFHFLRGWTVARSWNHCTTLSETSKYILEF